MTAYRVSHRVRGLGIKPTKTKKKLYTSCVHATKTHTQPVHEKSATYLCLESFPELVHRHEFDVFHFARREAQFFDRPVVPEQVNVLIEVDSKRRKNAHTHMHRNGERERERGRERERERENKESSS